MTEGHPAGSGAPRSSISFDHAADFYDQTRALPPEVEVPLIAALAREIRAVGPGRVLEVGVGTGRIARPLAARGVRVCGVDIAPRMLARLRRQLTPAHTPPDLLLADATRLPFAAESFSAVIICHVLHLVSDWRAAVAEILRALRPGGVLLHHTEEEMDAAEDQEWFMMRLDQLLRRRGFARSRRVQNEEIDAALEAAGGTCRTGTIAQRQHTYTPAAMLALARQRIHSWTWEIPEELLSACLDELEPLARERFGDLEAARPRISAYRLQVWTFG